jgi:hypothetical protein
MDLSSMLVIVALAIVVAGYIARPLLEKRGFSVTENNQYASELQAKRDQILMILQELDMDHAMGKIPTEEYQSRRPLLVARGAAILRELDRLNGVEITEQDHPEKIEVAVTQELDAQIEEEILRKRKATIEEVGGYCPQCGNELHSGDKFCTSCGYKVTMLETGT